MFLQCSRLEKVVVHSTIPREPWCWRCIASGAGASTVQVGDASMTSVYKYIVRLTGAGSNDAESPISGNFEVQTPIYVSIGQLWYVQVCHFHIDLIIQVHHMYSKAFVEEQITLEIAQKHTGAFQPLRTHLFIRTDNPAHSWSARSVPSSINRHECHSHPDSFPGQDKRCNMRQGNMRG